MSTLYLPIGVSQAELAEAVADHLAKELAAFRRDFVERSPEVVGFSATLAAARKLGVECLPLVTSFAGDERHVPTSSTTHEKG